MQIPDQRVPRARLIQTWKSIVAVEVEAVVPEDDAGESRCGAESAQLLSWLPMKRCSGDRMTFLDRIGVVRRWLRDI
jgi:hypothetical protein